MQKPQLKRSQQSPYWDDREPQRGGGPPAGVKVMKKAGRCCWNLDGERQVKWLRAWAQDGTRVLQNITKTASAPLGWLEISIVSKISD